jgi:hypothetical protein
MCLVPSEAGYSTSGIDHISYTYTDIYIYMCVLYDLMLLNSIMLLNGIILLNGICVWRVPRVSYT